MQAGQSYIVIAREAKQSSFMAGRRRKSQPAGRGTAAFISPRRF
jgi:hypothetical protein